MAGHDGPVCDFCGADCPIAQHRLTIPEKSAHRDIYGWRYFRRQHQWTDPKSGTVHEKGEEELACPGCWAGDDTAFINKLNRRHARWASR
jgi:hypothetical protein